MANAPAPVISSMDHPAERVAPATDGRDLGALLIGHLDDRWQKYRKQLKRCQKKSSEKSVHDLRVATRRLISLMDIVVTVAPDDRLRKLRRTLKKRFDALSLLRDTQVQLLSVEEMLSRFPQLETFRTVLKVREQRQRKQIDKQVAKAAAGSTGKMLLSTRKRIQLQFEAPAMHSAGLAAVTGAVGAAFAKAVDLRRNVKPGDTRTIHRLRVAFKKFRYMVEVLQPVLIGVTGDQFKAMNAYQVRMGNIQDIEVLTADIDTYARRRTRTRKGVQKRSSASRLRLDPSFRPVLLELTTRRIALIEEYQKSADELFGFWKEPARMPDQQAHEPERT